jgi:hypothetical protein
MPTRSPSRKRPHTCSLPQSVQSGRVRKENLLSHPATSPVQRGEYQVRPMRFKEALAKTRTTPTERPRGPVKRRGPVRSALATLGMGVRK